MKSARIVITGVGLTAPNGNSLAEFRRNLLAGVSGVEMDGGALHGAGYPAGVCHFDPLKYQKKKELRVGTRAGSISIYCAREALADSGIDFAARPKDRVGIYIGCTEHGNVETENEIYAISKFGYDTKFWSHYHNPRTVANNPAGEVSLHLGITGPAYTIGAACAAGNLGLIHAAQMLRLGEVDLALCGGVSESIHTFGIFAGFKSQGALAIARRPAAGLAAVRQGPQRHRGLRGRLPVHPRAPGGRPGARGEDLRGDRRLLREQRRQRLRPAQSRRARPSACARRSPTRASSPRDIHIVNTHATATPQGDIQECEAIRAVFGDGCPDTWINNTKSFIGHCMGAAGALELAGNLPSFDDRVVHPTINVDDLDPLCALPGPGAQPAARRSAKVDTILNNSFGMLGINSTLIVKRYVA